MKFNLSVIAASALIASSVLTMAPAHAQSRFRVTTPSGTAGAVGVQGENGSAGCVGGFRSGVGGGKACAVEGTNGSSTSVGGAAAGVGGFRKVNRTYTNPTNGNTHSGSVDSRYNAQTGQGSRSVDRSGTVNGTSYGYETDNNYNYTPGSGISGSTNINTQNNGSYTCSYASGSGKTCTQP